MHKEYRFVENIFEELDAPGEWWLNRDSSILYYCPVKGERLAGAVVEVSQLKNSLVLQGGEGNPVKNVHISGLHFLHNERSFMETKESCYAATGRYIVVAPYYLRVRKIAPLRIATLATTVAML